MKKLALIALCCAVVAGSVFAVWTELFPANDVVLGCWEHRDGVVAVECFAQGGAYNWEILGRPMEGHWERVSPREVRVDRVGLLGREAYTYTVRVEGDTRYSQAQGEPHVIVWHRIPAGGAANAAMAPSSLPPNTFLGCWQTADVLDICFREDGTFAEHFAGSVVVESRWERRSDGLVQVVGASPYFALPFRAEVAFGVELTLTLEGGEPLQFTQLGAERMLRLTGVPRSGQADPAAP